MIVLGVENSLSGLSWKMAKRDERLALALSQRFDIPDIVSGIMASRGITLETADDFLNPTLKKHLPNPLSLKDMERAANRMADAVELHEPIGLMGDYDVDGATSTALLKMFLTEIGVDVFTFIPDREDGYGPNALKMKEYYDKGCRVIATLDCGMTAFEPIQYGKDLGADVIVLDHHEAEKTLPEAYAVVNPKRLDEDLEHPCRYMAAVGVVFLFTVALNGVLRQRGFYQDKTEPNLMRFLDLVAFGTVCDVMRLQGVNRLLVKAGLNQMRKGENKGLRALEKLCGLSEPPGTYHLGYMFGPRVNACGRVGKSDIGMRLLSSNDDVEATCLAEELNALNEKRKEIESAVLQDAIEQADGRPSTDTFVLVKGENWHQGVIGIVAGRLKDRYNLPVFALSIEGDDVKGSSRSIQGVDIGTLIMNALTRGILTRGGGHPMAAGFSLKRDKLDEFYSFLKNNITVDMCQNQASSLEIDGVLDIMGATPEIINKINLLSPFGEANPEPRFVVQNVRVVRSTVLNNGHISLTLTGRAGGQLQAIAFRAVDTTMGNYLLTDHDSYFHVAGVLKMDMWRGQSRFQLQIHDIAKAL